MVAALHSPPGNNLSLEADGLASFPTTTSGPEKDNEMTSSVPLQTYRSPGDYSDDFDGSPARKNTLSYADEEYDPYAGPAARPWSNTTLEESTDSGDMHKPSLSYGSKEQSK